MKAWKPEKIGLHSYSNIKNVANRASSVYKTPCRFLMGRFHRSMLMLICLLAMWIILCSLPSAALAETQVSGNITQNTTWTLANSPYIVTGSVLVSEGIILTIEPGVVVKFEPGKAIRIDGTLVARGTGSDNITFTTNSSRNYWGFIFFSPSSTDAVYGENGHYIDGSILEYCVVEYAGGIDVENNGAIRLDDAHPFINCCTIKDNNGTGISAYNLSGSLKIEKNTIRNNISSWNGGGICTYGGTVFISENIIIDNSTEKGGGGIYSYKGTINILDNNISNNNAVNAGGIYSYVSSDVAVLNNIISNNKASKGAGGIQFAMWYGTVTASNNTVINNKVTADTGGGINITDWDGTAYITKNLVSGNIARGRGAGIFVWHATIIISDNIIIGNSNEGTGGGLVIGQWNTATVFNNVIANNFSTSRGAGLFVEVTYGGGFVNIFNNSIIGNCAENASAVYFTNAPGNPDFNYNTITLNTATGTDTDPSYTMYFSALPLFIENNIFNNVAEYSLYNENKENSEELNAKNNWWGKTEKEDISDIIYDWYDDISKGLVNFDPWDTVIKSEAPISPPIISNITKGIEGINIEWQPNPESDVGGYKVYWDTDLEYPFTNVIDVGNTTSYTVTDLTPGTYNVAITAYDQCYDSAKDDSNTIINENQTSGNESWYSEEKSIEIGPDIETNSLSYDFGSVPVDSSPSPIEVTISNIGTQDLQISDIFLSVEDLFSLDLNGGSDPCGGKELILEVGSSTALTISFNPVFLGMFETELIIHSDDQDTPTLSIPIKGWAYNNTNQEDFIVTLGENKVFTTFNFNQTEGTAVSDGQNAKAYVQVNPYQDSNSKAWAGVCYQVVEGPNGETVSDATISITLSYKLEVDFNVSPPSEEGGGSANARIYVWINNLKQEIDNISFIHNSDSSEKSGAITFTHRLGNSPTWTHLSSGQTYEVKAEIDTQAQVYKGFDAFSNVEVTVKDVRIVFGGPDSDGDGMPDIWEASNKLNPSFNDAFEDIDGDDLSNLAEYTNITDPNNPDTDGDGIYDGWEVNHFLSPFVNDASRDADRDGYSNIFEYRSGTDPNDPNSKPQPICGDIDFNGNIDLYDAILSIQVLSGIRPVGTVSSISDVNGDGKIGMPEVIYIMQKVSELRQ